MEIRIIGKPQEVADFVFALHDKSGIKRPVLPYDPDHPDEQAYRTDVIRKFEGKIVKLTSGEGYDEELLRQYHRRLEKLKAGGVPDDTDFYLVSR